MECIELVVLGEKLDNEEGIFISIDIPKKGTDMPVTFDIQTEDIEMKEALEVIKNSLNPQKNE